MGSHTNEPFDIESGVPDVIGAQHVDIDDMEEDVASVAESSGSVVIHLTEPACTSFADHVAEQQFSPVATVNPKHSSPRAAYITLPDEMSQSEERAFSPTLFPLSPERGHRRSATEDVMRAPTPTRNISNHSRSRTLENPGVAPVRSNPLSWGWLGVLGRGEEMEVDVEDPEVLRDMVAAAQKKRPTALTVASAEDDESDGFQTPLSPLSASHRDRFRTMLRPSSSRKPRRSKTLSQDLTEAPEEECCVMCLLPLSGGAEEEEEEEAEEGGEGGSGSEDEICIVRPCGHQYHTSCMFTFFSKCSTRDCPMCRGAIDGLEKCDGTFIERLELNSMFKVPCVSIRFRQVLPTISAAHSEASSRQGTPSPSGTTSPSPLTPTPRRPSLPSDRTRSFFTQNSQVKDVFHESFKDARGVEMRKVALPSVVIELLDSEGQVQIHHDPVSISVIHSSAAGTIQPNTAAFECGVAVLEGLEIEYTPDQTRPSLLAVQFKAQSVGQLVHNKSLYVGVRVWHFFYIPELAL